MALKELLNPFELNAVPEMVEHHLDYGFAVCCAFDRQGHWLACGLSDGRTVVWDFVTKGVVRELPGHTKSVVSVSWSHDSSQLLTGSTDWSVKLWDLSTSEAVVTITFGGPLLAVQLHPRSQPLAVVSVYGERPSLLDLEQQTRIPLPVAKEATGEVVDLSSSVCVAQFDNSGRRILVGGTRGVLNVVATDRCLQAKQNMSQTSQTAAATIEAVGQAAATGHSASAQQFAQSLHATALEKTVSLGNTTAKSIVVSGDGKHFFVNCQDRVIRLFDAVTLEPIRNFVDSVNRFAWKACCFSSNSEYVVAGSAHKANHKMYIWSLSGHLERILEHHKNGILAVAWHPFRPTLVSCSSNGIVSIWTALLTENWSSFAPNFRELEENIEYVEREDEFDIASEDDDDELRAQRLAEKERAREAEELATVVDVINDDGDDEDDYEGDSNNDNGVAGVEGAGSAGGGAIRRQSGGQKKRRVPFALPVLLPNAELTDLNQTTEPDPAIKKKLKKLK